MHLGKLVQKIGEKLNAQGSGHRAAGVIIGKSTLEKALNVCVNEFIKSLRKVNNHKRLFLKP